MECGCNIGSLKCPLSAINREMLNSGIRYSSGCHGMVELDDHPGIEKPAQGHKQRRSLVLQSEFLVTRPQWKMGRLMIKAGDRSRGRSPARH